MIAATWKPAAFRTVVKATARQVGIKNTAVIVLFELLSVVNYRTGHARTGTPAMCEKVNKSERTVKTALQQLRDLGLIYYVSRAGGGRTAVYGFRFSREAVIQFNEKQTEKRGAIFAPLSVGQYWDKEGNYCSQDVQKTHLRGAKIAPPSPSVNKSKGIIAPASRGAGSDDAKGVYPVASNGQKAITGKRRPKDGESAGDVVARWDREDKEALRAAMNGERVDAG